MVETTNGETRSRRRSPIPWLIGAILVALLVFFALRGSTEEIDRDGSSNADPSVAANSPPGS